jgi:MurNAc alpha-1-phosphate uridylyltransferase
MLPIAILAGGYGTRLGEVGRHIPKSLVQIDGVPFIDLQLDLLERAGYQKVVLCVSQKAELLINHLSRRPRVGLEIEYSFDGPFQLGTGGSIKNALPLLGSKFALIYGDSYLPIDFISVENEFLKHKSLGLVTVFRNENRYIQSNIEIDGRYISKYEKGDQRNLEYVDYGLSYWDAQVFLDSSLPTTFDLQEVYSELIGKRQLHCFEVNQRFYEVGSVEGIEELEKFVGGKHD